MKEFELIKHYFSEQIVKRKDVVKGIGDDCAVIAPIENQNIVVTTDTLVAGVHFPLTTCPRAIGHKAVAVNLSDIAAMGAKPSWISLALTLPEVDEAWLAEFCAGVFELCEFYNVELIGGDTTQGPLSITITAQGLTPVNSYLSRSGAKTGDWIYVTGELGDAALALQQIKGEVSIEEHFVESIQTKLDFPKPKVLAGQVIREYASSAIDISDGLIADLGHICQASNVGANIVLDALPLSNALRESLLEDDAIALALAGGDDYELLFTVSEDNKVGMETALSNSGTKITCIGQLNASQTISTTLNNKPVPINSVGFEHFSQS
ncbi:thiamine-phosphate kinase [Litorilituus sediminis]|uniref:Thiamine-monophosphate kinase n=1 Tax=Litorilituus sediminis TaxID=718192 RepID=A0A4P6P1J7_9GAMM|nr:thiamine-phosphate kinase [Litorilituus sediminis]QBG35176.1 thiamine-phosphate kinase [Litorilituus sediminis]